MTDPLTAIADHVRQLVDPYQHTERYLDRVGGKQKILKYHAQHPSLLDQLRAALEPGSDDEPASVSADPAAPIALGALDVLMRIEVGSAQWVSMRAGMPLRKTCEGNLRALVGAAATLDGHLPDLASDVETWWRWARVESAWDGRPRDLRHDPCPLCAHRLLRVAWDVSAAWCRQCGAAWGQYEVGMLGAMLDQQRTA